MTEAFIFGSALRENFRIRRLIIWLVISVGGLLLARAWRDQGGATNQIYAQLSEGLIFKMVALASAVYATAIVGQEVEQKTISYLLTRPIERWRLLLAKYLAAVTAVIFVGVMGVVGIAFGTFGPHGLSSDMLMNDIKAIFFGAFAYGGLFLFISLLLNRSMIFCMIYAFGWETFTPNMPGELYYLSIFSYMKAIAQHGTFGGDNPLALLAGAFGTNLISPGTGYAVLLLVSAGFTAAACWWFSSFEYVPREDAG
jgi:ABC-2 type transport system permease protein